MSCRHTAVDWLATGLRFQYMNWMLNWLTCIPVGFGRLPVNVAAKFGLSEGGSSDSSLLQDEACQMKLFNHPNVVRLVYMACMRPGPIIVGFNAVMSLGYLGLECAAFI